VGSDKDIKWILEKYTTVAVIGLSRNPSRDSYRVAKYLRNNGYKIIPINPFAEEIMEETCYGSLLDLPKDLQKAVEIVDIFRPSEDIPPIVDEAIRLRKENGKPHVIWMQLEIRNEEAATRARNAGFKVIMDKCILIEHKILVRQRPT
jgi:predicted CoA-binding protein